MKKLFFFLSALVVAMALNGQSIVGKWKTIDDETNKSKSVVEIYEKAGKYYGRIVKLFRETGEDPDPLCEACTGSKKNQKVIGLEIISGLYFDKDEMEFKGGEILDPENGKTYDCKIWIEDGKLKVRGYLYFLYRTQTWLPVG